MAEYDDAGKYIMTDEDLEQEAEKDEVTGLSNVECEEYYAS